MKKKNLLIFNVLIAVFLACICFSCYTKSSDLPELVKAERIMEQYPDSALHILENLSDSVRLSTEQNAMYCLLLTEAKDKTYETHKSDSLINIAVDYFEGKDDLGLKAKAWFYKGRVTQELLDGEQALDCYLKAIPDAEDAKSFKLLALIYNFVGKLYRQQGMYEGAISSMQKSCDYCLMTNDTMNLAYGLRNIGRIYIVSKKADSAFYYYNEALKMAEVIKNVKAQASILSDLGAAYRQLKDYSNAILMVQRSIPKKEGNDLYASYLSLARLYFQLNRLDSTEHYLSKAEDAKSVFIQEGVFCYKSKLALEQADYKNAILYNERYQSLRDSISKNQQKDEIMKLTYQYRQKEMKKELEQKSTRERLVYFCCIFCLLAIIGLGGYWHIRNKWAQEQMLRLQEKRIQQEKELRLQSLEQIRRNLCQIETNENSLLTKEADLQNAQKELLVYNTKYLNAENELIKLRREELAFRDELFYQTEFVERIRCVGSDVHKLDGERVPFLMKEFPQLVDALNKYYDNFVFRLKETYPQLKDRDIEICCLLKAGAKTGNIASLIPMTPNAVTKKKRLLLEKMEIMNEDVSLEQFLSTF